MIAGGPSSASSALRSSPSCERNREALGRVLEAWLTPGTLLEVGSGTGQHAAYLIDRLDGVLWQPSDRIPDHGSINGWAATAEAADRVLPALALDARSSEQWREMPDFDALLTVNTLHIMDWGAVTDLFSNAAKLARDATRFFVYGPFHVDGKPTSEGNAVFDVQLRAEATGMGIRDLGEVRALACRTGWVEVAHYHMPANNQMLVFARRHLSALS
ncbi:MAG: DUF938 domain-containing protein [Pseudomonadota bacterium]